MSLLRPVGALAAAALLALTMTACGSDSDDTAQPNEPAATATDAAVDQSEEAGEDSGASSAGDADSDVDDADDTDSPDDAGSAGGDSGRMFGSSRETVITAVKAATSADDIFWDGSTLVVEFKEGSVSSVTPVIKCPGASTLLAADEKAVLRFPDGDYDCSDRPGL